MWNSDVEVWPDDSAVLGALSGWIALQRLLQNPARAPRHAELPLVFLGCFGLQVYRMRGVFSIPERCQVCWMGLTGRDSGEMEVGKDKKPQKHPAVDHHHHRTRGIHKPPTNQKIGKLFLVHPRTKHPSKMGTGIRNSRSGRVVSPRPMGNKKAPWRAPVLRGYVERQIDLNTDLIQLVLNEGQELCIWGVVTRVLHRV